MGSFIHRTNYKKIFDSAMVIYLSFDQTPSVIKQSKEATTKLSCESSTDIDMDL